MAEHELKAGDVSVAGVKLTAATVEVFKSAEYLAGMEIISDGAAAAYMTIDGSEPTVGGANCYVLPANVCVRNIAGSGNRTEPPVVKIISAGTPTVSVSRSPDGAPHLVAL